MYLYRRLRYCGITAIGKFSFSLNGVRGYVVFHRCIFIHSFNCGKVVWWKKEGGNGGREGRGGGFKLRMIDLFLKYLNRRLPLNYTPEIYEVGVKILKILYYMEIRILKLSKVIQYQPILARDRVKGLWGGVC